MENLWKIGEGVSIRDVFGGFDQCYEFGYIFLSGGKELLLRFLLTRKLDGFLLGTGEPTKGYSIVFALKHILAVK